MHHASLAHERTSGNMDYRTYPLSYPKGDGQQRNAARAASHTNTRNQHRTRFEDMGHGEGAADHRTLPQAGGAGAPMTTPPRHRARRARVAVPSGPGRTPAIPPIHTARAAQAWGARYARRGRRVSPKHRGRDHANAPPRGLP